MNWMDARIGQGYDVHTLIEGHELILGSAETPHTRGLLGHSDVDVLLHAIINALFDTAGLDDIGRHFPGADPTFVGTDSRILLREAICRIHKAGYAIGNVDATVIAQKPKLMPHVPGMMANPAENLDITPERCSVRAKTNGKLGFEGRKEGIIAQAVVLIHCAEGADQD